MTGWTPHKIQERTWTAIVAPLGVPTADNRAIARSAALRLHRPHGDLSSVLMTDGRVGRVNTISIVDGWLCAAGTVTHPDTIAAMQVGELYPEIALTHVRPRRAGDLTVFDRGILTGIRAGHTPAWPGLSFTLEDPS